MTFQCKICFEHSQDGKPPKVTSCGHVLCEDCAAAWFESQNSCPVCRREINISVNEMVSIYDGEGDAEGSNLATVQGHDGRVLANEDASGSTFLSGLEEIFQVKYVLAEMGKRWQQLMVERAQLKNEIISLNNKVQALSAENEVFSHFLPKC